MSLVSTSKSAAVFAGLATACKRRATTRTSGAAENSEPPAITHSNPSARSASAYRPARVMAPRSTTMSPGAWPSSRSAAKRRASSRAAARLASSACTPAFLPDGSEASTMSMRGALPRQPLGRPSCGSSDMNASPNTWGCSNTRSTNDSTSRWLRKFFESST